MMPLPPRSEEELVVRANALAGHTLGDLARLLSIEVSSDATKTKGKWGDILEKALGATGGSRSAHDFEHLGVELKSVPMRKDGKPVESTYVCVLDLRTTEAARWEESWARSKLSRVLFVPILAEDPDWQKRRIGRPTLWSPTDAQDAALKADFDEIVGAFGAGRIEEVTAHWGKYMQVRPKARTGEKTEKVPAHDGELVATVKKGFYLRAPFVGAILRDPSALP